MDEREFELVNIIGGQLGANQRDLSRQMELSLGMTNMLIRRVLAKGYIRIRQLNKKKVEYILTPKGFSEKMRKSVRYTLKTINSISLVKDSLARLLRELHEEGVRRAYILGSSDLAGLIEIVIQENGLQDITLVHVDAPSQASADGVFLACRENVDVSMIPGVRAVNVIEELAKDETLRHHGSLEREGLAHV